MNIKSYLLLFLAVLTGGFGKLHAQQCGSDIMHHKLMNHDSSYAQRVRAHDARWASYANNQNLPNGLVVTSGSTTTYEIPVVFHIMHTGVAVGTTNNPSDATVATYVDYLNKVYAAQWSFYVDTNSGGVKIPIKFVLAKRAPSTTCGGVATTGINRINVSTTYPNYTANGINLSNTAGVDDSVLKSLSIWNPNDYYNIWMVNYIDGPSGGIGGYAVFPGAPAWQDGTVILAQYATPYANGTYYYAVPHELGHAFGLYHTFEGSSGTTCPTNTTCTSDGDGICDTEPHINLNNGVCASGINPCTGVAYNNVQYNLMNYTACPNRFTAGQRTKAVFNLVNYRAGLVNSMGTTAPATFTPPATACIPSITNAGNPYDVGPNEIVLTNTTTSASVFATASGGYTSDGYLAYWDRTCTQSPAALTAGTSYTIGVTTYSNAQNAKVWIDYNNDGTFSSGEVVLAHTGTITGTETHTATFTVPTTGVTTNTSLRMRVMADFGTTPAACTNLSYGQAEDYTVIVSPASITPTITIAANPVSPICAGTSVTFTATVTNAPSPTYAWKKNGGAVGTNSPTYTTNTLANGDVITCSVTTGTTTVTSTGITMTVNALVTPSVTITPNPSGAVCAGTSVTYTANPTNGGTTPTYQWTLNGVNTVTTSTYTVTPANGNIIAVTMTSNATCPSPTTATASTTAVVNAVVVPAVAVAANPGNTICAGTSVTFTATPTNGGTTPAYQWKLNGGNVGTGGTTYTNAALVNGDIVTCVLTSNATCATPTTATSSPITMVVTANVTPSVAIAANPGSTICNGTSVTFTATPTNGGTTPSYQWKLNGVNVGTGGTTYTNAALANGNTITCVMTSNATCATTTTATSNTITMVVNATVVPAVAIAANPGNTICSGTSVTFTATPTNGGTTPAYQWKLNGVNVTGSGATYTNAGLLNGDIVTVVMTSNLGCASPATATSNAITMVVNANVTPSVAIAAVPGNTICSNTSVTFTATPTNGGTTPVYQWKLNGGNVGTGGTTYTNAALANGDVVTCVMTSNATCATTTTATSNAITMVVNAVLTPSVAITANPGSTICNGTSVTFTAAPTNGGTAPVYQWKLNGVNVGTGGTTYTNAALANGNIVTCVMTSNLACASPTTATSNAITMVVNANVTASVAITANPGVTICSGTSVTFTATPTNGGTTPTYQWKLNGVNVGTGGTTYTNAALANGNIVTCVMTTSLACATPNPATSNALTMVVTTSVTPSVAITANPGATICNGTSVTFTATPTNGGTTPAYQWKLNGGNVGTGLATYTNAALANGAIVTCVMTSNATCATTTTATSNAITMVVTTPVAPTVTIAAAPGTTICSGTSVTFTATPTNGGTTPAYQWKLNGGNVGTGLATYTNAGLLNGDIVTCVLTSNATCLTTTTATSNSLTMVVNANVTPSVTIAATPAGAICPGTSVTFTPTPVNGGTTPTYSWLRNGIAVATTTTYTTTTLTNGETIRVVMTGNAGCMTTPTANSNTITQVVNTSVTPTISISANPATPVCAGTSITFTAATTNGGTTPAYQWKVNGINVGTSIPTYTSNGFSNGDLVTALLTSSVVCPSAPTVVSNSITVQIVAGSNPSVTVAVSPNDTVCAGTLVTFTATPTNGGPAPTYAWRNNGTLVSSTTNTYSTTTLHDSDIITVIMTGNTACATTPTAFGNITLMRINPLPNPVITRTGNVLSTTSGYVTYQWNLATQPIVGATASTQTATADGDYTVSVTDANGCSNTSAVYTYQHNVSVGTVNGHNVSFYPNPAQNVLYIQADEAVNVGIYSMEGKVILQGTDVRKMDISQLADGMYMIQIRNKQNQLLRSAKLTKATF